MARYLVTGGAGFIGSHLSEALLEAGHQVVIFDDLSTGKRSNIPQGADFIYGDIRDAIALSKAARWVDGIYHLAAIASVQKCNEDWAETHAVNSWGTVCVFQTAAKRGIPVVYASSAAVYGKGDEKALGRFSLTHPISAYGQDKLSNEWQARIAGETHGLASFGLRFFNVYGPRQDPNSPYSGVISIFTERMMAGKSITIFGDGQQSRDFIYVKDLVAMLMVAMDKADEDAPVYAACTGVSTTLLYLVHTLEQIMGETAQLEFGPKRTGDITISLGDHNEFYMDHHARASTTLRVGLEQLVQDRMQALANAREAV